MKYATFWQRFGAGWIDFFVMLPAIVLFGWLATQSLMLAYLVALPSNLMYWAYCYYLHAVSGQTIGKRVVGIRVVQLDGGRIDRPTSFRRSVVDLVFSILSVVGTFLALRTISSIEYASLSWTEQTMRVQTVQSSLFRWVEYAAHAWVWSEVITVLFNHRRRAIHDYIAGTCVVTEATQTEATSPANP